MALGGEWIIAESSSKPLYVWTGECWSWFYPKSFPTRTAAEEYLSTHMDTLQQKPLPP
jgi:hypothetical protein